MTIVEFFKELVNPESIIEYGGLMLLAFVVFAETGLFFGFFLPGDSLLFTAGLLTATGVMEQDITVVLLSVSAAAFLGNYTGYFFGKKVGQNLYKRQDSLFFKRRYVDMASDFYSRYGGFSLIMGRFLPIIRTFAPILAGVIRMDFKKFTLFNLIGCILWVFSLILLGYFFGLTVPNAKEYLGYIIIGLIIITLIPLVRTYLRERRYQKEKKEKENENEHTPKDDELTS